MVMIVKSLGSQMGSPAPAEGGGEAMGRGRGEIGERSKAQARSTLTLTKTKASSRSREVATLDEAPRISQKASSKISVVGIVVIVMVRHSARTDISMFVYNGDICAYIGFLVDTDKASPPTTPTRILRVGLSRNGLPASRFRDKCVALFH